jgi:hypothetical protein
MKQIEFLGGPRDGDVVFLEYPYPQHKIPEPKPVSVFSIKDLPPMDASPHFYIHIYELHRRTDGKYFFRYTGMTQA